MCTDYTVIGTSIDGESGIVQRNLFTEKEAIEYCDKHNWFIKGDNGKFYKLSIRKEYLK